MRRLWQRQLAHYPERGARTAYLAITVVATIVLYYELYVQGAVATQVIRHFDFTFTQFVMVLVVGNAAGAFASLFAGLADRWGRANLVVGGLVVVGLLVTFAMPNAHTRGTYMLFYALVSFVEGMALVATPALMRDFSPQVGRGVAMAFWTMGPVLGSVLVTEVSSRTLDSHPAWQFQFHVSGAIGLAVAVVALLGLRELSPQLRDQIMHSMRDRQLVEARAAGIDPEEALEGHWRQMLRWDVVGSALGISLFLLLYYILVAFLVVYFVTNFGYSEAHSNDLANWYWITDAIALAVAGVLSDRLRVRKPFMVAGALISLVGVALFTHYAHDPGTSYDTFAWLFVVTAFGGGMAYVSWMAAFTETVEKHNPAGTATGLAVWGWILRLTVTGSFALLPVVVPATSTLVDKGSRLQEIVSRYPQQVQVLQKVDRQTLGQLQSDPQNRIYQASAVAQITGMTVPDVAKVAQLGTTYSNEVATAGAIDAATLATLSVNPNDPAAIQKAVGEISAKLKVTAATAMQRLLALGKAPRADLLFLQANAPKVQAAAAKLQSLPKMPAADIAYLSANATKVTAAKGKTSDEWRRWWLICLVGQILFIPCAFLLTGRWSPRRAREDDEAHERMVAVELERLKAAS